MFALLRTMLEAGGEDSNITDAIAAATDGPGALPPSDWVDGA
jgi:hypothetical protein